MQTKVSRLARLAACALLLGACSEPEHTTTLEVPLPPGTTAAHVYAAARARNLHPYVPHGDTIILAPAQKAWRDPYLGYWIALSPGGDRATMWVEAYARASGTSLPVDMGLIDNNTPTAHGRTIAEEDDPLGAWTELRALARQLQAR